ncbi:MAG: hydrogenase 4 subunit F [Dissulfurispiraceae bacterium]|jgi:hydrogenase-4 component F|nr:hydrogenase 4 subunit F [Dissulfurispiraceae bacterium]
MNSFIILYVLAIPVLTALICYFAYRHSVAAVVSAAGSLLLAAAASMSVAASFKSPLKLFNGMLFMDPLSGYMMSIIVLLGLASSLYSAGYLKHELHSGLTSMKNIRRYYALLHIFIFTMLLVTVSNNLALMWIAIEATTLVSALLIGLGVYKRELAIEAAWKYIILCSVGITFALLGVFITYYASFGLNTGNGILNWTELKEIASKLNPATMKLAFIFIIIGYGTKAGLAPLHNWLPDAHSQAPSPISALLSGVLLNTAFYGILRFVSIVEPSAGSKFTGDLLVFFGIASMIIASVFILVQKNYKRLLAYSSIEHMGIISIAAGIGGVAALYGALLHVLNHAVAKPLMFFASGRIQSRYGTSKIDSVCGVLKAAPLLGCIIFIGVFALAGSPPFNIFISKFSILMAAADNGQWTLVTMFLIFSAVVFYGMVKCFGRMLFGCSEEAPECTDSYPPDLWDRIGTGVMFCLAVIIIVTGLWLPEFINNAIKTCTAVIGAF